jgi:hypothetical protein
MIHVSTMVEQQPHHITVTFGACFMESSRFRLRGMRERQRTMATDISSSV